MIDNSRHSEEQVEEMIFIPDVSKGNSSIRPESKLLVLCGDSQFVNQSVLDPDQNNKKLVDYQTKLEFKYFGFEEKGDLLATYEVQSEDLKEWMGYWIRITTEQISIFDREGQVRLIYSNVPISDVYNLDEFYLYALLRDEYKRVIVY